VTDSNSALPPALQDDKTLPLFGYGLTALGAFSFGTLAVVGVVLAYVAKRSAPEWLQSHYIFQIRTFWLAVLFSIIGAVTTVIGIGVVILAAVGVWTVVRCIIGFSWLIKNQPYPTPRNWMI